MSPRARAPHGHRSPSLPLGRRHQRVAGEGSVVASLISTFSLHSVQVSVTSSRGRDESGRTRQHASPIRHAQLRPGNGDDNLYRAFCTIVGGVISPLLSNVYLDKLDTFVEQ